MLKNAKSGFDLILRKSGNAVKVNDDQQSYQIKKIREFATFGVFTKFLAIFDRFPVNTKNGEKINKNKAKEQNFSRIIFTEKNHVDVKCHLI